MNSRLLEIVTTLVLATVVLSLGWMIAASYAPRAVEWASQETEVMTVVCLLALALILVSATALWHTRPGGLP
jgi:hypothetical protein